MASNDVSEPHLGARVTKHYFQRATRFSPLTIDLRDFDSLNLIAIIMVQANHLKNL